MPRKALIQIRRGLEADIGRLEIGELAFCTDSHKFYIGTSTGNVLLVAAQSTGDMLKSIYDTNNNGKIDSAETADSVPWSGVSGRPATFAPTVHQHNGADITVGTIAAARLPAASISASGITQLSSATNSTSTTLAATPSAVKAAMDIAAGKLSPGVTWGQLKGV